MNLNATIFFQTFVFFVLGWFTMKFVWPPLIKAIDQRRQRIAEGLAAAEKGKADLAQAQTQITGLEALAKSENQARLAEANKQATTLIDMARSSAEQERTRIVAQAKQEAQQDILRMRTVLREEVAVLAIKGAEQILKREIDARVHGELLAQLKTQL